MSSNEKLKYASWSRILASTSYFCITWGIFNLLCLVLTDIRDEKSLGNVLVWINLSIILNIFFLILNVILYRFFGGDIGKLVCGIKVKNADMQYLSIRDFLFREFIGKTFSGLFLFLGYFYIFFNKKSQAFHDLLTETYVFDSGLKRVLLGTLISTIFYVVSLFLFYNFIVSNKVLDRMENHLRILEIEMNQESPKNYGDEFQSLLK